MFERHAYSTLQGYLGHLDYQGYENSQDYQGYPDYQDYRAYPIFETKVVTVGVCTVSDVTILMKLLFYYETNGQLPWQFPVCCQDPSSYDFI